MSKEEKIDKILEMSKEILLNKLELISDEELDKLYIQTKIILEAYKELEGEENEV